MTADYVVCATPRSGSTLLCHLLRSSGVAGYPQSWFRAEDRQDYARDWGIHRDGVKEECTFDWGDYVAAARVAGQDGGTAMGLRIMWPTLVEVQARLRMAVMPGLGLHHAIFFQRRDPVAQAVSRLKAEVSGTWHLGLEEAEQPAEVHYDFARIQAYRDEAAAQNALWNDWFAASRIVPLQLDYEDLAADPTGAAQDVLQHLGLTLPAGRRLGAVNRRMADAQSADWIAQFHAEAMLRGC